MPTKDELEAENARLRAELDQVRQGSSEGVPVVRPAPTLPTFGMSEGTRQELEQAHKRAQDTGKSVIVVEPFTGAKLQIDPDGAVCNVGEDGVPLDSIEREPSELTPDTSASA